MKPRGGRCWQSIPEDEPLKEEEYPFDEGLGEEEGEEEQDLRAERHLCLLHDQLRQVELEEEQERRAAAAAAEAMAGEAEAEAAAGPAVSGVMRGGWGLAAWIQPLATLNASAAACLALLAVGVAVACCGFVGLLVVLRSFGPPAVLEAPLHFDYSTPSATALVQIVERMPVIAPRSLAEGLGSAGAALGAAGLGAAGLGAAGVGPADLWSGGSVGAYTPGSTGLDEPKNTATPATPTAATTAKKLTGSEQQYRWSGQLEVVVQLEMPAYSELFQVTGELLTATGRSAARSATTYLPKAQPWLWQLARHALLAPCYAIGYCSDMVSVRLPLFKGQAVTPPLGDPITHFRATLTSRAAAAGLMAPPAVHKAQVQLSLKTGLLKRLFLWCIRPSLPLALSLGSAAIMLALGSGVASLVCGAAAIAMFWFSSQLSPKSPAFEAMPAGMAEPTVEMEEEQHEDEEEVEEPG